MKKKEYIAPQVGQYRIDGPIVPFAASGPNKAPIKIDGKDEIDVDGNDDKGLDAGSRRFDGWSWDD